jgi:hypothetical protein|eukprot:CAMPEP_0177762916 /NCGR_PEP_ID=MMETSP0491_2-20121128/6594_1 /TAXON_ID=63592 /ORGANISM="Tetraselmis chuii, Strain PLY429" /LENGTH=175 /DNA_ID=CAMNT_0019278991 /DNA_START=259 /DNA_END=786 /DNA_ORIENTATION=-
MGVLSLSTYVPARLPTQLRTGPSGRGRSPVSLVVASTGARPQVVRAVEVASTGRDELIAFPGEDAPRTGRRQLPPLVETSTSKPVVLTSRATGHRGLSTEEYYRRFPAMARASCPLDTATTAFVPHLQMDDCEGPGTGNRVRPSHAEEDNRALPNFPVSAAERRKLVQMRRSHLG